MENSMRKSNVLQVSSNDIPENPVVLNPDLLDFIEIMRDEENQGITDQIEVIEDLIIDLIRDETMGEDNNRKYLRYLADILELTRLLLPV